MDNVNMIPVTPIEGDRCNQMCHIRAAPSRGGISGGGGVVRDRGYEREAVIPFLSFVAPTIFGAGLATRIQTL
jgi:hypothetical protein